MNLNSGVDEEERMDGDLLEELWIQRCFGIEMWIRLRRTSGFLIVVWIRMAHHLDFMESNFSNFLGLNPILSD